MDEEVNRYLQVNHCHSIDWEIKNLEIIHWSGSQPQCDSLVMPPELAAVSVLPVLHLRCFLGWKKRNMIRFIGIFDDEI